MNVDNFGHHVFKRKKENNELPFLECALKSTNDGNLNAQKKIITNLGNPVNNSDGATKDYVDKSVIDRLQSVTSLYQTIDELKTRLTALESIVSKSKSNNNISKRK